MPAIKGRYWLLTIPVTHLPVLPELRDHLVYLKGQQEIGEQGLHHWQLLAVFGKQVTLNQAKAYFCSQAHLELSRSEAADSYVWKEETAVPETRFEKGQKPFNRNKKTDWELVRQNARAGNLDAIDADVYVRYYSSLKRIAIEHATFEWRHNINVRVYWGGSGLGKTRRAWHEAGEDVFVKDPCSKWWDGYRGQKKVIIDEFTGVIRIDHILKWLDRYPCIVEAKGTSTPLLATEFWITSNIDPRDWYTEITNDQRQGLLRRINITHFITEWFPPAEELPPTEELRQPEINSDNIDELLSSLFE